MHIDIILVAPARPENVGAAARAMKTMGFPSLRIVASDAHRQPAARWVAHGAGEILEAAQTFDTLAEALQGSELTVATTARSRTHFHYYSTPQALQEQLTERQSWVSQVALVFGREESGLTNEELQLADLLTAIPMQADYPSLNLGQAVMVYCYQLSSIVQSSAELPRGAVPGQLQALRQRVEQLFVRLAVGDDRKLHDWLHQRLGVLEQRDTAMLHTLLQDIEKRLDAGSAEK